MFILGQRVYQGQDLFDETDFKSLDHLKTMYVLNGLHPDLKITPPRLSTVTVHDSNPFIYSYITVVPILGEVIPCIAVADKNDSIAFFTEEAMKDIKENIEECLNEEDICSLVWDDTQGLILQEDEIIAED